MNTRTRDLMTPKLISIPVGASLAEAQRLMDEKRFRHLPVVDDEGIIVGVLSARDYSQISGLNGFSLDKMAVQYFMNAPVEYVSQDMPIRSAAFRMLEKKISSLIIADPTGYAIGILTTDDLLWYLTHLLKDDDIATEAPFRLSETIGGIATILANSGI